MSRLPVALGSLMLAAVVASAYYPTTGQGFVWDDRAYIESNPAVHEAGALWRALASDADQGANAGAPASALYRPLTFLSLYLNARLLGDSPASFHLGNLLLHLLSTCLLFAFLARRLGDGGPGAPVSAWVVSLLWALHPEQVEAVAWVSGRYDLLGTCLFLAALNLQASPRRAAWLLQALLVLGAALSKETFAPAALVLGVDTLTRGRARPEWPRLLLLGGALLAYGAQRSQAHLKLELEGAPLGLLGQFLGDYLSAVGLYAVRALVPTPLALHHPFQALPLPGLAAVGTLLALAGVAALRNPRLLAPLATFALLMAPVAVALNMTESAAERYFLGPSLGLAWALAIGLEALVPRRGRLAQGLVAGAALAGLIAAGRASAQRLSDWESEESLFSAEIRSDPSGWFGYAHLGMGRASRGAHREAVPLLVQAHERASAQRASATETAQILNVLAQCFLALGDDPSALATSTGAVRLAPHYPGVHLTAALAYFANERAPSALRELDAALGLSPEFHLARSLRAEIRARTGDRRGAEADLEYLAAHAASSAGAEATRPLLAGLPAN